MYASIREMSSTAFILLLIDVFFIFIQPFVLMSAHVVPQLAIILLLVTSSMSETCAGNKGFPGTPGIPGVPGTDGKDGAKGEKGDPGIQTQTLCGKMAY